MALWDATLATIFHEIDPKLKIQIIEKLPSCGLESSAALNNAGTGHAGNCELNYTPVKNNKIISIKPFQSVKCLSCLYNCGLILLKTIRVLNLKLLSPNLHMPVLYGIKRYSDF